MICDGELALGLRAWTFIQETLNSVFLVPEYVSLLNLCAYCYMYDMCYPKLFLSSHFKLMRMWAECLLVYPLDVLSEMCAIQILHIIIII